MFHQKVCLCIYTCAHAHTHTHTHTHTLNLKAVKLSKFIEICAIMKMPLSESIIKGTLKDDVNTAFEMLKVCERHNRKMPFKRLHMNM